MILITKTSDQTRQCMYVCILCEDIVDPLAGPTLNKEVYALGLQSRVFERMGVAGI